MFPSHWEEEGDHLKLNWSLLHSSLKTEPPQKQRERERDDDDRMKDRVMKQKSKIPADE